MIQSISKITLYVRDQEEARRFWVDQCHFRLVCDRQTGPVRWLEVSPGPAGASFVLYDRAIMESQEGAPSTGHPSVILSTDNAARTYEQMKADDVEVSELQELPYGTMFTFRDPEGNAYLLRQDPVL